MAFPAQIALPVPKLGEPVGRAWLASHGHPDGEVSVEHLTFVRAGSTLAVLDERSRNGTFVGGVRVAPGTPAPLVDGAVLRIGRTLFVYRGAVADREPDAPLLRKLVGPWGLKDARAALGTLHAQGARNVLVEGPTGAGKELVAAAAIAALRRPAPHATVNMAAISAGVFEAHLFGWRRGAFSGSGDGGPGVFAAHDGRAVFLDELGELPLELQPRLLRLLENREIQPVGASAAVTVDVAIVAATNRDLDQMVRDRTFRADLLARFDRRIQLPALKDRPEDVYAIISELCTRENAALDRDHVEVEAVERLLLHNWEENVREVVRLVARLKSSRALTLELVEELLGTRKDMKGAPLTTTVAKDAVAAHASKASAARALGVSRGSLLRALKKPPQ